MSKRFDLTNLRVVQDYLSFVRGLEGLQSVTGLLILRMTDVFNEATDEVVSGGSRSLVTDLIRVESEQEVD